MAVLVLVLVLVRVLVRVRVRVRVRVLVRVIVSGVCMFCTAMGRVITGRVVVRVVWMCHTLIMACLGPVG